MGNALKDLGKLDEAIDVFNKAIYLEPDYAEAYSTTTWAITFKEQGKLDKALRLLTRPYPSSANFADAHYNLKKAMKTFENILWKRQDRGLHLVEQIVFTY